MPKNTPFLDLRHRERIKTSMILNRLQDHISGTIQMSSTQIAAALGLLRKVLPDLAAVEHQGEVKVVNQVLPEPLAVEWKAEFADPPKPIEEKPETPLN